MEGRHDNVCSQSVGHRARGRALDCTGRPERMVAGDGNDQDRRALHAGQRPRHSVSPNGGADRPRARTDGGGGEPPGRRPFVINPPLQRASYDPSTSFEPVCYLAATPMVLVVLGSSPYRTLNDLITAARAKPGELAFASGGPGSSLHIAIEVLKRA